MIDSLKKNQIFIFGSNLVGNHAGGAAKQAREQFGAIDGVGEGPTGQCYAFPTLDYLMERRSIDDLVKSKNILFTYCKFFPNCKFLLTKVGTGIAGYSEEVMKFLFENPPTNLILPEDWN